MPTSPQLTFLRPIESDRLTQAFGENSVCAKCLPGGFPVRPFVVVNKPASGICPPGTKDFYKLIGMEGHNGGDWAAWRNEPTYHCGLFHGKAQICRLRDDGSPDTDGGLNVISNDPIWGDSHLMIRYAHGAPTVKDGDPIAPGDLIMKAGDIGSGTGVHVHWAPKACTADGKTLNTNNGYQGAFNYNPYFKDVFILDYIAQQKTLLPPATQHPVIATTSAPTPATISTLDGMRKALFQAALFLQKLYPHS